jgi:lipopolysaccharide/colanic/teichoic acid biosynthesis glycosyltransferase
MSKNPHPYYSSMSKRVFDVVLSAALLLLLSPLLAVLAVAVYITVGSPVIFAQYRAGANRKPFQMLKFRTMRLGAEIDRKKFEHLNQAPYPMFKIFEDPRFIGIGRWLSQTGFDELPQLFNIFSGEMSFVGPRPLPTAKANQLDAQWDFRYLVKPGIFSYWTLSKDRHKSLQIWRKLEEKTLIEGGLLFEITIMTKLIVSEFGRFFKLF